MDLISQYVPLATSKATQNIAIPLDQCHSQKGGLLPFKFSFLTLKFVSNHLL